MAEEHNIELQDLIKLHDIFNQSSDKSLIESEFVAAFESIISAGSQNKLTPAQLMSLFMKIDANSDGGVDWDEFTSYLFSSKGGAESSTLSTSHNEFLPSMSDKTPTLPPPYLSKNDPIFIIVVDTNDDSIPKPFVSASKNGVIRKHQNHKVSQSVKLPPSSHEYTSVCVTASFILISSTIGAVYALDKKSLKIDFKIKSSELLHSTPICIASSEHNTCYIGDESGTITLFNLESKSVIKRWNKLHRDHVTCIKDMSQELNVIVSSSLDSTMRLFSNNNRECKVFTASCSIYDFCATSQVIAFVGLERKIVIWSPYSFRVVATLSSTTLCSSIKSITASSSDTLVTLSSAGVVHVWNIRDAAVVQEIRDRKYKALQCHSNATLLLGSIDNSIVYQWNREEGALKSTSGASSIISTVMFNKFFNQVLSVDKNGVVNVYDIFSSELLSTWTVSKDDEENDFSTCPTYTFDYPGMRRMISSSTATGISIWNYNNGSLLYNKKDTDIIITMIKSTKVYNTNVIIAATESPCDAVLVFQEEEQDSVIKLLHNSSYEDDDTEITNLEVCSSNYVIAGDSRGGITAWNLSSLCQTEIQPAWVLNFNTGSIDLFCYLEHLHILLVITSSSSWYAVNDTVGNKVKLNEDTNRSTTTTTLKGIKTDDAFNEVLVTVDSENTIIVYEVNSNDCNFSITPVFKFQTAGMKISALDIVQIQTLVDLYIVIGDVDGVTSLFSLSGTLVGKFGVSSKSWDLKDTLIPSKKVLTLSSPSYKGNNVITKKHNHHHIIESNQVYVKKNDLDAITQVLTVQFVNRKKDCVEGWDGRLEKTLISIPIADLEKKKNLGWEFDAELSSDVGRVVSKDFKVLYIALQQHALCLVDTNFVQHEWNNKVLKNAPCCLSLYYSRQCEMTQRKASIVVKNNTTIIRKAQETDDKPSKITKGNSLKLLSTVFRSNKVGQASSNSESPSTLLPNFNTKRDSRKIFAIETINTSGRRVKK